jgi:hypothetical protein
VLSALLRGFERPPQFFVSIIKAASRSLAVQSRCPIADGRRYVADESRAFP